MPRRALAAERVRPEPARPIVKWAGGKSRLTDVLVAQMPPSIGTYIEPFCGGAALFFRLASEPKRRFRRAILADKNAELVACYRAVRDRLPALCDRLRRYHDAHHAMEPEARRAHYYEVRERATHRLSDVERGARLLFLNKTCFNGLWRENASGRFNVPFGRYERPKIFDPALLTGASRALADVEIAHADFAEVTAGCEAGDFVYFDPPYVPLSRTASFTSYAAEGFDAAAQARLASELGRLRELGVRAMLSNAHAPSTAALYAAFHRKVVPMKRAINSDPRKRGDVDEIVVLNYAPPKPRRLRAAS